MAYKDAEKLHKYLGASDSLALTDNCLHSDFFNKAMTNENLRNILTRACFSLLHFKSLLSSQPHSFFLI